MRSKRPRPRKGRSVHGWLALDKPSGCTSNKALTRVKRLFDANKAGYAGTLDPIACGVLPIALGEATKTVEFVTDGTKCYRFQVRWGEATNTDDREGEVIQVSSRRPTRDEIEELLPRFTGDIELLPPQFSAIRVNGTRAYAQARRGIEVKLAPRPAHIEHFSLLENLDLDHASFAVTCGRGVYMRSLARELAQALGTCAHVTALRRWRVGSFTGDKAVTLDELEQRTPDSLDELLQPIEQVIEGIPTVELSSEEAASLRHGRAVTLLHHNRLIAAAGGQAEESNHWLLACSGSCPIALVQLRGVLLQPRKIFNTDHSPA